MSPEEFSEFRHEAVHALMRLNENCQRDFRISSWSRWDYDFDRGTLTFSQDGVARVIAVIQVVGTTSATDGYWLWGWANQSLPANVVELMAKVRSFGEAEGIAELTAERATDDEHLGWGMTAIAARVLGAKGGYRCPGENGFIYLVYTDIGFADDKNRSGADTGKSSCDSHGSGFKSYVCEHLAADPVQKWFSQKLDDTNRWPDAWCGACDVFFQEEGEWNKKNETKMKIKILCHFCYERCRALALPHGSMIS